MKVDNALVWLGTHSSAIEYLETLERGNVLADLDPSIMTKAGTAQYQDKESRFGDYGDMVQVVENVAIVPIQGSMMAKESWLSRVFGIMAYDTIGNIMAEIVKDGGVDTVVLDIDSPGGEAKGLDAATEGIQAAEEAGITVVSHTAGQMASAAYWIGSAASVVAASETAEVGSVGVIGVHGEASERNKKEGVTYTVLRKGEEKALASPYEKLSDKARNQIEESMERKYDQFVGAVSQHRGLPSEFVKEKIASGRVFASSEALELGMIDEVIAYNDLVSRYVQTDTPAQHGTSNSAWSEAAMHKQPIVNAGDISPEEAALAVAAGVDPKSVIPQVTAEADEEGDGEELADVEVVDGAEGDEGAGDEEAGADDAGEGEDANAGAAAVAAEVSAMEGVVNSLNAQLVEARVKVNTLESRVTELEAGNAGLRGIAVEQTQRLRVGMGGPEGTTDLEAMSDMALVTAHQSVFSQAVTRFRSGASSRVPEGDATPAAAVTRMDKARRNLTSIK